MLFSCYTTTKGKEGVEDEADFTETYTNPIVRIKRLLKESRRTGTCSDFKEGTSLT